MERKNKVEHKPGKTHEEVALEVISYKVKIPVSRRAVMARINRKLAKEGKQFWKYPSHVRGANVIGPYLVTPREGVVTDLRKRITNLENFARKLGVLRPWETVNKG